MKLITLNIWGGQLREPLLDFLHRHRDVDIFCLQEVYYNAKKMITEEDRSVSLNIFSQIMQTLPEHQGYFCPAVNGIYGIAKLVHHSVPTHASGELPIYINAEYTGIGPSHNRLLQWIDCGAEQSRYTVINVHGLWNGKGKSDSPDRIAQSQKIKEFIQQSRNPVVLCGDFNLRPDTKSLEILDSDMKNLIHDYQIKSTRTSYYPKQERFADYILLSPDLVVHDFEVLQDEVSDHNALYVEFE
jgi:endonuclease/exonuclease/phosphatase family metal-dependent hydrolase